MGGHGSGSWQTPQRRTVEEVAFALDVRKLGRAGYVTPGADVVAFRYRQAGEETSASLPIEWTPCNYGGERPWFSCPRCERRAAILYSLTGAEMRCRTCLGLTYPTRRLSVADRLEHRARKLYARAGTHPAASWHHKPARMHWSTFNRIMDSAQAHDEWSVALTLGASAFMRRYAPDVYALARAARRASVDLKNSRKPEPKARKDAVQGGRNRVLITREIGRLARWRFGPRRKPLPLVLRRFAVLLRTARG